MVTGGRSALIIIAATRALSGMFDDGCGLNHPGVSWTAWVFPACAAGGGCRREPG